MRKAPYLIAVFGIGFLSCANPGLASPLAGSLANPETTLPALTEGWVEKVQHWSCREKYRDMTLSQRRFCFGYGYGDRYAYPRYGYGYRRYGYRRYDYGYPGYALPGPFIGFGLGYWAGRHWDD